MTTTAGGTLLVLALMLPALGVPLALVLGGRWIRWIILALFPMNLLVAGAISDRVWRAGETLGYVVGNWEPPLGIVLRADPLAASLLMAAAVVMCAVALFASADFEQPRGQAEQRVPLSFWVLLLSIWCGLNAVAIGGDLFTLYVALELLTFAAVPIVSLSGSADTFKAALRYLLFALAGSSLYLLGTALLYGSYGTLDIALLSSRIHPEPVAFAAAALMTVGLFAKTALFPLHFWLPPAHAGAPAAGSAVLSALVVKGSFLLTVRLWFDGMPGLMSHAGAHLIGGLGAAAIVFGTVMALRQQRLKLLIAYSTLAQIGFLFLVFPVALRSGLPGLHDGPALTAGMLQLMAHATAKAAMFMAAGSIYAAVGHDRIGDLGQVWRRLPISVLALLLGGAALIGLPPGGAYVAKKLLLQSAAQSGETRWWASAIEASGILTSSYLFLIAAHFVASRPSPLPAAGGEAWHRAVPMAGLALCSWGIGIAALAVPVQSEGGGDLVAAELASALVTVLAGAALAVLAGRWAIGRTLNSRWVAAARAAGAAPARAIERIDRWTGHWPIAGMMLLIVAAVLVGVLV